MIDFQKASVFKLSPCQVEDVLGSVSPLMIPGEEVLAAFRSVRDLVVFTTRRLIAVNIQGITGKKRDFTSLPYNKIQAFSVETAGTFDLDAELELWFSGLGRIRLEFKGSYDITELSRLIGHYVL